MTVVRAIHERGVVAPSALDSKSLTVSLGLRPVIITVLNGPSEVDLTLSPAGRGLSVQLSKLYSTQGLKPGLLPKQLDLAYDVSAAVYHCERLAGAYASIVKDFEVTATIPGVAIATSDMVLYGNRGEPFYELDALLSAARRAYDKLGHWAWAAFEGGGGGRPDNLEDFIRRMRACPAAIAARLRESWATTGAKLTDYRDCTQHFSSTGIGLNSVHMKRLPAGGWSAWARIPDNPEVKSRKRFVYAGELDALTYGWEVVGEVVGLCVEVIEAGRN